MAYEAGASLGKFWNAMLTLRSQRLEEQEIEAKLRAAQQAQMMEMGQRASEQIGGAILGGMKQKNTDALYNQMVNQMIPPRAEAADPELAASMARRGMGPTPAFTGGKEGFDARMALAQQQQANLAQRALTDYRKISTAKQAWSMAPDLNKAFNTTNAYTKQMDVLNESMTKALETRNQQLYENTASGMNSLHEAYMQTNPKSQTPPPQIPPFVHPDDLKQISEAQQGIRGLESQVGGLKDETPWINPKYIPSWVPKSDTLRTMGSDIPRIQSLKEQIAAEQEKMKALPGAEEYFKATPQAGASAGAGAITGSRAGQIVGGFPLGKRVVNPQTREVRVWNGVEWEPQQ